MLLMNVHNLMNIENEEPVKIEKSIASLLT